LTESEAQLHGKLAGGQQEAMEAGVIQEWSKQIDGFMELMIPSAQRATEQEQKCHGARRGLNQAHMPQAASGHLAQYKSSNVRSSTQPALLWLQYHSYI
jgi:hypothetical protein